MDLPNRTFRTSWQSAAVAGQPPELQCCPRSSENRQTRPARRLSGDTEIGPEPLSHGHGQPIDEQLQCDGYIA
jgi:hypothetical protein